MQKTFFLATVLMSCFNLFGQSPNVSSGTMKRHESFASKHVDARNIDVWLPAGYSPQRKYAVLYMHDGQMLFDAATTWNKQEWQVDETAGKLIKEGKIKDTIIVGVWNNGEYRHSEYYPHKSLANLSAEVRELVVRNWLNDKPRADDYLKFLVEELKPFIDKTYATKKDRKNTFIAGSSMGGLISIYAICEYPEVFGGAAGISTHLPMVVADLGQEKSEAIAASFRTYLEQNLPAANSRKIYFDYGDQTLDAYYPPLQKKVDEIMLAKGFTQKSWVTRSFPGEDHSERSWAKRFGIPLEFLLGKN